VKMRAFKILVAAVSACLATVHQPSAQQPRDISFGMPSKSVIASVPRIADEMGFFAKHGLKPKFSVIDSTAATAAALLSKSIDFATTGTTEVIAAAARDQKLVVLNSHYAGLAGSLVLSKAAADKLGVSPGAPAADRLKALNNLTIASVSKVSSFTIAYKGAATAVGAEPRFVYMAVNAMGAALETGAIDGAIITGPFWAFPVLKGTGVLWLSPPKGDLDAKFMPSSAGIAATTRAYADANPDVVKAVVATLDDLSMAFAERPADVKAAIGRLFPELDAKALDLVFSLEAKAYTTKPLTAADIAHDLAFMKLSGLDLGPIDTVDPASVMWKR
jgi:ABC-type nitrate/sulfonate/bicarbonate transport system substrate-binding protein